MFIDRSAYVAQKAPGFDLLEAELDALLGYPHQLFGFLADLPDAEHTGGVGVVAVIDGGDVDVDDVALLEDDLVRGNAVADLFIDRGAHALGEALIV